MMVESNREGTRRHRRTTNNKKRPEKLQSDPKSPPSQCAAAINMQRSFESNCRGDEGEADRCSLGYKKVTDMEGERWREGEVLER